MRDVATQAYDRIEVGATGWMRPDPTRGETLEGFQSVLLAAQTMQEDGLILIQKIHRESQCGKSMVDAIQFMKMK